MLKRMSLMISLFVLLSFPMIAEEEQSSTRLYCSPEQIELNESMILMHLDTNTVEIDNLHVDQGGIYFYEDAMRCLCCRQKVVKDPRHTSKNICECPMR